MKTIDPKHMTEDMSRASAGQAVMERGDLHPKKGDRFRCMSCGMEIQVTAPCTCKGEHPHFQCCGQEMQKR
jgi:hypothetical protein